MQMRPIWQQRLAAVTARPQPADRVLSAMRPPARLCAAVLLFFLIGTATADIAVIDDTGANLQLTRPPQRLISLAPGATEMLFYIGAGARVVGTANFSDEPAAARNIARVGDALAVDAERILKLRPELIIVWDGGNANALVDRVERLGIPIYRQRVAALRDLPASLRRLGILLAEQPAAERAAQRFAADLSDLQRQYGRRRSLTVLLQIWDRPLYTIAGNHLMSDALSICGARNIFADLPELAPILATEAVLARDPEVIVAAAPPGSAAGWIAQWRRFPQLRAVKANALVGFENQALGRLGPSALRATRTLCERLDRLRPSFR